MTDNTQSGSDNDVTSKDTPTAVGADTTLKDVHDAWAVNINQS